MLFVIIPPMKYCLKSVLLTLCILAGYCADALPDDLKDVDSAREFSAKELLKTADSYFKNGYYTGAATYYKQAISVYPGIEEAYAGITRSYVALAEQAKAEKKFQLNDTQPAELIDYLELAERSSKYGNYEKSIAYYERALNLDGRCVRAFSGLADIYQIVAGRVKQKLPEKEFFYDQEKAKDFVMPERRGITQTLSLQMSPLKTGRNNQFHAIFDIPSMEAMGTLKKKEKLLSSYLTVSISDVLIIDSGANSGFTYNTNIIETPVEFHYGITDRLEVFSKLALGMVSGQNDGIAIVDQGISLIPSENRAANISDLTFGAKYNFYRKADELTGFSTALYVKYPVSAEKDWLTSDGITVSVNFIGSYKVKKFVFHGNAGITAQQGRILNNTTDVSNIIFYGIAGDWAYSDTLTLIMQIEGNTNAFTSIDILETETGPVTAIVGARYNWKNLSVETGFGAGLTFTAADFVWQAGLGYNF
ncbi:MAG: DUF3187 family protein [Planctomycetes bacterium]|nr:DUF3187 family protein [Planctomycetota bacterium]